MIEAATASASRPARRGDERVRDSLTRAAILNADRAADARTETRAIVCALRTQMERARAVYRSIAVRCLDREDALLVVGGREQAHGHPVLDLLGAVGLAVPDAMKRRWNDVCLLAAAERVIEPEPASACQLRATERRSAIRSRPRRRNGRGDGDSTDHS